MVGVAAGLAVVVLVSLAISPRPAPPRAGGESPAFGSPNGIAGRLLSAEDLGGGFVMTTAEEQSIADIASGARDQAGERARLESLGFREAAIAVAVKPPDSPGPLAGTSLTIQIVRFGSPADVRSQLDHDRAGALAADFGIRNIENRSEASAANGDFIVRGTGPVGPGGAARVAVLDAAAGDWQLVVAGEWAPGVNPASDQDLKTIAEKQVAKLA